MSQGRLSPRRIAPCLSDMEEVAGDVAEEVVEEIDEIV
jgi:hypothetical protein